MRVPLSWLSDYIAIEESAEELATRLTFAGIEVEGIERIGSDYAGLLAAEVRDVAPHPAADRLKVCRVFDGRDEHTVVCGAPDVQAGGRYAFAPVGASLPDGTRLRKARLRGVDSHGMLLAEDELGLSDDHSGLYALPAATAPGTPLAEVLGPPETVLDLEITPNRPDCLSLWGIAREIAALTGRPLREPPAAFEARGAPVAERLRVEVEDPAGCPRYTARLIRGVRVAPSPAWMQRRLTAAGIRPISNVVDVTNYVLVETGHPLHAFDADRLRGHRLIVRRARAGERIRTLDEVERELRPEMLVIADTEGPVALAGIMGGAGSEIGEATRDVAIESAMFDPASIRRTARDLKLDTESSHRFARGADIEGLDRAARRVAALILELAGGEAAAGVQDVYPAPYRPREIRLRWSRLSDTLGRPAEPEEALAIFARLGLEPDAPEPDGCRVRVPSFRRDLALEADLIEEVARIGGLDRIPERAPGARLVPGARDETFEARESVRAALAALGLQEVLNVSLCAPALLDRFDPADAAARVRLPNPLSEAQSVLRTALIPQVVETLGRNRARQAAEGAVFEIGRVYRLAADGAPAEEERVAVGLFGPVGRDALRKRAPLSRSEALQWVRGLVEGLLADLRIEAAFPAASHPAFEPDACRAVALDGQAIGHIGLVRRTAADEWRLPYPVAAAELGLGPLLAARGLRGPARPPPVFPAAERDLAFYVDSRTGHGDIEGVIRGAAPAELERVELFDIYEGKGTPAGRKSMAYALTWRSSRGTLTDEEVQRFQGRVVKALRDRLGAELRDA